MSAGSPQRFFSRINAVLGAHLLWLVMAFLALGLLLPDVFSKLNGATVPMFAFMTFTNSLGGDFRDLARVTRSPLPVLAVLVTIHAVMPLLALGLGQVLFPHAPLFTMGLLLEFSLPTAVSSLMWVSLGGGNVPLCLALVLLDTLMAPVVIPLTLRLLSGSVVQMDTAGMMWDLLWMVAIPALLAMALHQASRGRAEAVLKPCLDPAAKLMLLIIIAVNATGCAPFLRDVDRTLLLVIAAVLGLCLLGYAAGYWLGRLLGQPFPTLMTMSLNTGVRNISAGAVLALQYFPAEVLFPVAFTPLFSQLTMSIMTKLLLHTGPGRAWTARQTETPS
jgi:BASS family bile acid:Na+ symporter